MALVCFIYFLHWIESLQCGGAGGAGGVGESDPESLMSDLSICRIGGLLKEDNTIHLVF